MNKIKRLFCIKNCTILFIVIIYTFCMVACDPTEPDINNPGTNTDVTGDTLYNGIVLSAVWPPENINIGSYMPMKVPYLEDPPSVIPINVGRQLFVDDFLIETSNGLERIFYNATKISGNPVLKAETNLEKSTIPGASLKDGGVWWDEAEQEFKMWYEAGWLNAMAYAISKDGIVWEKPTLNIGNQNQILPGVVPNSCAVVVDYNSPATERYQNIPKVSQ